MFLFFSNEEKYFLLTDHSKGIWSVGLKVTSLCLRWVCRGKYLKNPLVSVLGIHTSQLTKLKLHYFFNGQYAVFSEGSRFLQ